MALASVEVPAGDLMFRRVYDPSAIQADAFSMDNMVETAGLKILTSTERSEIAANTLANHAQDSDLFLDFGNANQVSASELRAHVDDSSLHFVINDATPSFTAVYSSQFVQTNLDNIAADLASKIIAPVQDITALKAIDTTVAVDFPDKTLINVEDNGLYRLDRQATDTEALDRVVQPTVGVGRWFKMTSSINDHNNLSNIQGGIVGQRNHLSDAQVTLVDGSIQGSISDNQVAVGNGSNAIDGSSSLLWDGATFTVLGDIKTPSALHIGSQIPTNQASSTVSLGDFAGNLNMASLSVALGVEAGENNMGSSCTAAGFRAGEESMGNFASAFGNNAGELNMGICASAFGNNAGENNMGADSLALGSRAGRTNMGANGIIISSTGVDENNTVVGHIVIVSPLASLKYNGTQWNFLGGDVQISNRLLGSSNIISFTNGTPTSQSAFSTSMGNEAGLTNTGSFTCNFGDKAGQVGALDGSVNLGSEAGSLDAGIGSVNIGCRSGLTRPGDFSISIGELSGFADQGDKGIIISSTGIPEDETSDGHIVIKSSLAEMRYNSTADVFAFDKGVTVNGTANLQGGQQQLVTQISAAAHSVLKTTSLINFDTTANDIVATLPAIVAGSGDDGRRWTFFRQTSALNQLNIKTQAPSTIRGEVEDLVMGLKSDSITLIALGGNWFPLNRSTFAIAALDQATPGVTQLIPTVVPAVVTAFDTDIFETNGILDADFTLNKITVIHNETLIAGGDGFKISFRIECGYVNNGELLAQIYVDGSPVNIEDVRTSSNAFNTVLEAEGVLRVATAPEDIEVRILGTSNTNVTYEQCTLIVERVAK